MDCGWGWVDAWETIGTYMQSLGGYYHMYLLLSIGGCGMDVWSVLFMLLPWVGLKIGAGKMSVCPP